MDTDTARKRLEATLESLSTSESQLVDVADRDSGELNSVDQHIADDAADLTQADSEDALRLVVEQQRTEVQAALVRIDEGTYGTCVDCQQSLPEDRLEARPEAARCLDCQQAMEATR